MEINMANKVSETQTNSNLNVDRLAPATPLRTCSEDVQADQSGAPPSNTAPSKYKNTKILRSGIDSLYLTYPGNLRSELEDLLRSKKLAAQSKVTADRIEATVHIADQPFTVSGRGRGPFGYQLNHNWYHVSVSGREAGRMPLLQAQLSSEALTLASLDELVSSLGVLAEVLSGDIERPSVSRVDLCTDFVTDEVLEHIPVSDWVRRCRRFAQYYQGDRYSGLTFGAGNQLSCRLYDKTLEIEKSGKDYLHELWRERGWDGVSPVWRLEFQLRVGVLSELKLRDLEVLRDNLSALWEYCSHEWIRLAKPDGGKNRSRWINHPMWDVLQNAQFNEDAVIPLQRVRKDQSPEDDRLFVHGLGALTSFMAREGIDSLEDGIEAFYSAAHSYHRRLSQHTGRTLPTYVREKVQLKRTSFNARSSTDYDLQTGELK